MTRRAYVLNKHRLVVFWAQRAACTSIVDAILFDILGCDESAFGAGRLRKRQWLHKSGYRHDFREATRILRLRGFRSLALIRDPYERLVSIYLNAFVLHRGQPVRTYADLSWYSRDLYRKITGFSRFNRNVKYKGLSFADFVNAICDRIDQRHRDYLGGRISIARYSGIREACRAPWTAEPLLNPHWNTQIPFWFLKSEFRYDHLYNTDQASAFFDKLSELTGCPIAHRHANRSNYAALPGSAPGRDLVHENPLNYSEDPSAIDRARFSCENLRNRVRLSFAPDYRYLPVHDA